MKSKISEPVLVTGANGFIGANLVRELIDEGYTVDLILRKNSSLWRLHDILDKINIHNCDIIDLSLLKQIVNKIGPKTIFHLAAYGAYPFQDNISRIKSVILDGTINLIDACINHDFDIFINTGSNSEYGFKTSPMKESDIICPNSNYAVFKASATHFCQFKAKSENLPIVTVRPFHIYGPFEESSRLVPQLISKLLKNKLPDLVSPDIARDMLYVEDAVDLFIRIASKKGLGGRIFNMGSGKQSTIRAIVETAIKLTKSSVTPKWGLMKPRIWDQNNWVADMNMVKDYFDWLPRYSLNDGLNKTINWNKEK